MENIRIFVAIPLPEPLMMHLERLQRKLELKVPPRSVRWVRPESIHLTLKFLGDTSVDKVPDIEAALAAVARNVPACAFTAAALGCYPNPNRPRVIWVGVEEPHGILVALQQAIEEVVTPFGFPPEKRGFRPHLTIGRVRRRVSRQDIARIGELVVETRVGVLGEVQVEHFELIRSILKPTGAEYTTLEEFRLCEPG